MDAATVRSWIDGFEAARVAERRVGRTVDRSRDVAISFQLSAAALAARASPMKARREVEDERAREIWCRLKRRRPR